jgi:hypothetical protein
MTAVTLANATGKDVARITDAIVGGELERTIEGASTLTLEVHDPHRALIRSPDLRRAIDVQYEGVWFRLVKVAKSADTVTLTFEDRDVAYLRRHTRPRKVSRNRSTRAQFVRTLVREVKASRIKFYSPEVNKRQPIAKAATAKRTEPDREDQKQKGLAGGARLTVKGRAATAEQRRNGQRVLDVADELGAGPKATKALMCAVIVESEIRNLSGGDRDSQGVLQVRVSTSGSSARSRNIEWCCKEFLTKGFWRHRPNGAMALARDHSDWSAGKVAQETQGSAYPERYDQVAEEAQAWIDAYGGASGTDTGGADAGATYRRRYEFSRGKPGEREDSWTAIQRLAEEVQWRAFMDAGTLYFVSEDLLMKSRARYTMTEGTDGVNWIDFDVDQGKVSSEVRVSCRTELFDIRVGSVVAIREMGIADGRWLVATVRRPLFEPDTELTLVAPTPKLPEPDAEQGTRATEDDAGEGDDVTASGSGGLGKVAADSSVAKCYRKVDAIDAKNYRYAWGGGHGSFAGPYDCSGFVSAVLHAGGLLDTPQATPGLIGWGQLGEGKYMTVWVKENGNPRQSHTFMTFDVTGNAQRFAEAGGADSSHTGWHKSRNKAGFVPRHWPGT